MVTPELKRLLAEKAAIRAAAEATAKKDAYIPKREAAFQRAVDETFTILKRAAPFMDEGSDPKGWKPSDRLILTYSILATCENNIQARPWAIRFVHAMIARSRLLFINKFHPNPWLPNDAVPTVEQIMESDMARLARARDGGEGL